MDLNKKITRSYLLNQVSVNFVCVMSCRQFIKLLSFRNFNEMISKLANNPLKKNIYCIYPYSLFFFRTIISFDLEEISQTISIKTYFQYTWTDEMLTWNSSQYPGIDSLRLSFFILLQQKNHRTFFAKDFC